MVPRRSLLTFDVNRPQFWFSLSAMQSLLISGFLFFLEWQRRLDASMLRRRMPVMMSSELSRGTIEFRHQCYAHLLSPSDSVRHHRIRHSHSKGL